MLVFRRLIAKVQVGSQADTVELTEEVQETFILHNRSFQRYAINNNTYFVPVDEDETIRLRIQHQVLNRVFDQRYIFPPINSPRRVLDCGFGTGEVSSPFPWNTLALYQPGGIVRGIDITPHHHNPEDSLENLYLDIDDLNMPLQFPQNHFDLVNSRLVAGGINNERWTGYIRDIFRCLRPGGWIQMVEVDMNAQSDNGALTDNSALRQWSQTYLHAMAQCKNPRAPRQLGGWLRSAGFTDVDERMIPLPMCAWADHPRNYDIGAANQENVRMLLSSVALYPFTHYLGLSMSITEFHVLVAMARTEAADPTLKV
ncbi:S-adenosyl-L-methionine-dependent methyltransferase [Nemania sp. FL0916]|nr:S-adenosyl-L-methionine-dependent methyltransferase [Nemania sp. FL0916]